MKITTFLDRTLADAMELFDYYRHGPVPMPKLKPGFILQSCIDEALTRRRISFVERGLGDHCIPSMGLAIQLKTSVRARKDDVTMFCRSSKGGKNKAARLDNQIADVNQRMLNMFKQTETHTFVLVYINLITNVTKYYLLRDKNGVKGDWMKRENVVAAFKQNHFKVKLSKMQELV